MAVDIGLIRSVSAANKPYVDYAAGAKAHLERWYQEKQIDAEKIEKEKAAYELAKRKRAEDQEKIFSKFQDISNANIQPFLKDFSEINARVARQGAYDAAKEEPGIYREQLMNVSNQLIQDTKKYNDDWKIWQANYIDQNKEFVIDKNGDYIRQPNTISNVNDAFTYEMDRRKANHEFTVGRDKNNKPVYIFYKKDFDQKFLDAGGNEVFGDNDAIEISHDDIFKSFGLKEKQTKRYLEDLKGIQSSMLKSVKEGFTWDSIEKNVKENFKNSEYTDDELLSIAVDNFGFLPEKEGGIVKSLFNTENQQKITDTNNNGISDELRAWVEGQYMQGVKTTYNDALKAKANLEKEEPKNTAVYDDVKNLSIKLSSLSDKFINTDNLINALKQIPAFGAANITSTKTQFDAAKSLAKKELGYNETEATAFANGQVGNAILFINKQPINDLLNLLTVYNNSLSAAKRLSNSQLQQIIDETANNDPFNPNN